MGLRIPGRIVWPIAALVALVSMLLALAHTPLATTRVQSWLEARVAAAWKLELTSTAVEYNLLTRRVALTGVRLSAPGHADAPFFTASRVSASLPWAVFGGTVRLSSLQVDEGRVLLVREQGVLVNLPPSSGLPPPVAPRRLDIRGLILRDLDVDYVDRAGGIDVNVRDIRADLSERDVPGFFGAGGPLTAASIHARVGDHETTSGPAKGELAFDGSNAVFSGLTVPFPEGTIVADGPVNRVLDDASFDLALKGTLDMAPLVAWAPPPVPVSGAGTFEGGMQGKLGAYEIRLGFRAPALRIARADGLPLDGNVSITSSRAVVEQFRIVAPGASRAADRPGTIEGRATYTFGPAGSLEVPTSFRDLDLDLALAAYDREPLSIAAWEEGTATLTRAAPGAPLEIEASGRSVALARRGRIAVSGTWTASLTDDGQWASRHDHQMLDGVRVSGSAYWPSVVAPAPAPLTGPLEVTVADVGRAVRAARGSGLDVSAALEDFAGAMTGSLTLAGTIEDPRVEGRFEAPDLSLPTGASGPAVADAAISTEEAHVARFELTAQGMHVTGDALVDLVSGGLSGSVAADVTSIPDFARPLLAANADVDGFTGTAQLTATLGGTTDRPDVPWRLVSTPIAHIQQAIGVLTAEGRLQGTVVQVERFGIDQGDGRVEGSGRYDYESEAYTASLSGKGLVIGQPFVGTLAEAVVVDVQFEGAGTLDALGGSGFIRAVPEGGRIAELVGAAETRLQLAGNRLDARMFVPKLRAFIDASIEPRAPYAYRGTAVVSRLDIEPLALAAGALPERVAGTVGFSANFQGQAADMASATAFVNLQEVAVTANGVPLQLERPARLTVRANDFVVDDLSLKVGGGNLVASGWLRDPLLTPLAVWYGGPVGELVTVAGAFGLATDVEASGQLSAWWESTGGIDRASATATLRDGRVVYADLPAVEGLQLDALYDGTLLSVNTLRATWQGGGIEGTARLPRALFMTVPAGTSTPPGRADLKLTGLTQEALRPWLSPDVVKLLDGRVSATLGLDIATAEVSGITGTLVVDEASLTASGVPITQERPGRMSIANGVLRFDDVSFTAWTPVVIGGSVAFGETTSLDVTVTGMPGLRPLSVLSPQLTLDGTATLDLHITGAVADPRVTGSVYIADGEIVMRDPRVIASDIFGPIRFEGDRIIIPGFTGWLNGGSLEASGEVGLRGLTVSGGEVTFQAQGVAVEYPDNVDSEIDALLVFVPPTGDVGAPLLRGDVRVLRGAYRATVSLPALVAFNRGAVEPVPEASPYLDALRLDISVSTEEDLVVDNNYGRFLAGADLRLQGTVGRPGVTGRAELREGGEIFVLGGLYRLNESSISFTNPNAIEPDLAVSATTRSSGAEVTLTLSGTLDRLQTDVSSTDPDLTNESVASVLLGGNSLGGEDALALLSGELLGVTGRRIGLDSLRVERGFDTDLIRQDPGLIAEDTDPSTRLTMSKRLRSDVEVILSQDLRQSGGISAAINYRPFRSVELRAVQRDNSDRTFAVRHEITFGGGRAAARSREAAEVASIAFDGAGPDEAALRNRLRLKVGKRFDFVRWRDDVDRLERWLRERGHLEARVRASRGDTSGGVALTYRVASGPETTLQVEGTPVSNSLRRRLEDAWSDSIFDRFLLEELRREVALDLVHRNIVGAAVEAAVTESSAARKVVRIQVNGGQRASGRQVRFSGAQEIEASALTAVLRARGLTDYLWIDPNVVVDPLRNHYVAAGFRSVRVAPELPRFDGDTAVLAVSIDEGPVTRLAGVTVEGGVAALQEPVEQASRLPVGEPYRAADVDEARRRIEAAYRRRGFNDVVVIPRVAIDEAAPSATVAFAVSPGPEQRLSDVAVSGVERTRPKEVVDALNLDPGTPVDFGQWAQARKRVYDTNVFRQVEVRPEEVAGPVNADGTQPVRARVTVTEWPAWRLRYGVQLADYVLTEADGTSLGLRSRDFGVVADAQNRNVLGRAFTFGLYTRVERRLQSSSTYLSFPTLLGRRVQTNVFGSAARQDLTLDDDPDPDLLRRRQQISIEQRIRRWRGFEASYGYRLTHEVLDAVDPEDPFLLDSMIGRFTGTSLVDRRDDPFDATTGWFSSFTAERISNFDSGDDSIKLLGGVYYFQRVGAITLASAVRAGRSFLGNLPFTDRFFAGGADTVRGYAEGSLGPRDISGVSTGGNAQLILNQEVRTPLYGWVKGALFIDAGNVFTTDTGVSLRGLDVGYGVGLRFDTPFALLRLDVGIPARGGGSRWYFGIGQVF